MIHWRLYPSGKESYPWVIAPNVLYPTVYVRRMLTQKEKLHLWDFPQELWGIINQDQLVDVCKEISAKPPRRILETALRAILKVYGGYRKVKDKICFHIEITLSLSWKIKRVSFKGLCEKNTPEKIGIEK